MGASRGAGAGCLRGGTACRASSRPRGGRGTAGGWGAGATAVGGTAVRAAVVFLAGTLLGAAAVLAGAAPVAGQGAGSSASTLLRLAPGPRALALAHAFVAVRDPLALEYNPAAVTVGGLTASYQQLPVDASAGGTTVTFPAGPAALGVSLRFVNYGQIEVVESSGDLPVGQPTGELATGGELSALLGGGVRVGPVRLGLAGRWLHLDVAGLADDALVGDAGVLVEPFRGVTVGASIQGLGSEVRAGRSAPVLRTVRVGAAIERWYGRLMKAILTVEGRERESRVGASAGLELRAGTSRMDAALRIGYETRPDPGDAFSQLVFGGGVRLEGLSVEFAYRALGPLGATRQVGLRYRF